MRELLAVEAALADPSITALAVVGVVAIVVMVPMLALCGSCDEREPDPGPFDRPPGNQPGVPPQYQGQGRQGGQQYQGHPPHQQGYGYPPGYNQQTGSQQYSGHPQQPGSQQYSAHPQQYANSGYPNSGQYQQQPPQAQQFPHQSGHGQGYPQQGQESQYQQASHQHQSHQQQYPHQHQSHQQQYSRPAQDSRSQAPSGQAGPPGVPPSGTHLQPADVTLDAVEAVLFQVCDGMKGMIKPGKTLVRETIRTGVSAVIADVTTNYAVDETMMLFPDKNKKSRQMRLYEQLNLKDSMPLVSVDTEIFSHEENGRKVTLPAAIFVNRVKTLAVTLKGMKTIEEKQAELFGIWSQLAKVLKMFHQRGWYLRDVTYENVVHVRMGATEGWTLLEFGNASRPKSSIAKNTIPPRQCPPELAGAMLIANDEKVHLTVAGDMWMLGMLVYQVMTGEPYWKKSLKDSEVLQIMADPHRPLPHQEKPVLNLVQLILESLLHRDPNQRLTSSDLIKRLEQDMATAGAKTINPGPVVDEQPIVLDGT